MEINAELIIIIILMILNLIEATLLQRRNGQITKEVNKAIDLNLDKLRKRAERVEDVIRTEKRTNSTGDVVQNPEEFIDSLKKRGLL